MNITEKQLINENAEKALPSLRLDNEKLYELKSLDEVYHSIQDAETKIEGYLKDLKAFSAPKVDSPWYRIGGPSKDEINKALDSIVGATRKHLDLICNTDLNQSKNIQNLCLLVGLLAIAEGKLFSQFREFSGDADAATDILIDYERDLNDIAHNGEDTAENVAKMAQIMSGILEEKNKQIVSFKAYIEGIRDDNNNALIQLKNEIKKETADFEDRTRKENHQLKSDFTNQLDSQQQLILKRTEKSFLDSTVFKILVLIMSFAALICAIIL